MVFGCKYIQVIRITCILGCQSEIITGKFNGAFSFCTSQGTQVGFISEINTQDLTVEFGSTDG